MIKINPDAKVIRENRLTIVRTITTLYERYVEGEGGLKDKIKTVMLDKQAEFAESDLVVARLQPASIKYAIDPVAVYALVRAKKMTIEEFLSCITIKKTPLEKLVAARDVEKMSTPLPLGNPALFTEFKPGIGASVDHAEFGNFIGQQLMQRIAAMSAAA